MKAHRIARPLTVAVNIPRSNATPDAGFRLQRLMQGVRLRPSAGAAAADRRRASTRLGPLELREPGAGRAQRTHEEPRVGAADDVLDLPALHRAADGAARTSEFVERLSIEQIVAGEVREHDDARMVARRVFLQREQLLLRSESGGPVILDRQPGLTFQLRRPRILDAQRHRVGERIAECGDVDPWPDARVPEPLLVRLERESMKDAVADRGRDVAHAHDVAVPPLVDGVDAAAQPSSEPRRVFPSRILRTSPRSWRSAAMPPGTRSPTARRPPSSASRPNAMPPAIANLLYQTSRSAALPSVDAGAPCRRAVAAAPARSSAIASRCGATRRSRTSCGSTQVIGPWPTSSRTPARAGTCRTIVIGAAASPLASTATSAPSRQRISYPTVPDGRTPTCSVDGRPTAALNAITSSPRDAICGTTMASSISKRCAAAECDAASTRWERYKRYVVTYAQLRTISRPTANALIVRRKRQAANDGFDGRVWHGVTKGQASCHAPSQPFALSTAETRFVSDGPFTSFVGRRCLKDGRGRAQRQTHGAGCAPRSPCR